MGLADGFGFDCSRILDRSPHLAGVEVGGARFLEAGNATKPNLDVSDKAPFPNREALTEHDWTNSSPARWAEFKLISLSVMV